MTDRPSIARPTTRPVTPMIELEAPVIRYRADCEPCEYEGPLRTNNLTALGDWDQHVAKVDHRANVILAAQRVDEDQEETA